MPKLWLLRITCFGKYWPQCGVFSACLAAPGAVAVGCTATGSFVATPASSLHVPHMYLCGEASQGGVAQIAELLESQR